MGLSEFFKKTLKGAGFGAASGLAMALTEYVYLASTVPQFADAGELLTFGFGLAALFVLLGCVGGALLAAPLIPAAQAVRRLEGRFQGFARVLQHRALAWSVLGVSVACFFIFFVVNARAYHRLYAGYHVALTIASFCAGLLSCFAAGALLKGRDLKIGKRRAYALSAGAGVAALALFFIASPRLITNENLRAIISDRGVAAYHLLLAVRSFSDRDGDGFAGPPLGYDCDDSNPAKYPMAYDVPGDGVDQDCTGRDRSLPQALPDPPGVPVGPQLILILTIDAVRADRWPTVYKRNILPNLHALSRRGVYFSRAYSTSNWTVPSVYSLWTGRYPSHVKFAKAAMDHKDRVYIMDAKSKYARDPKNIKRLIPVPAPDRAETLAMELKRRGYVTATVLAIPFLKREMGMARGFAYVDETPYHEANRSLAGATADLMTRTALRVIRKFERRRLFLYMHYNDPHTPYRRHRKPTDLGPGLEDRYDAEIRFADNWVGVLLSALHKEGLLNDALVIITSDHGEEFREHGGRFHASTVYEEQIHVPMVIYGRGIRPGLCGFPVSHVDLFPTVLSLVDGSPPRDLRAGVDLSGFLRTGTASDGMKNRVVYAESRRFLNFKQAVVTNRYKLIRDNKGGATVLFDLETDPAETRNLVTARASVTRRLIGAMNRLLDSGQ